MRAVNADDLIHELDKDGIKEYGYVSVFGIPIIEDCVPVVRCKDCIYYDPPHIENGGKRYEYSDMPNDAFDSLGTGLVHSGYGVNVGGRCCVDDMKGYSEDKRVFVSESNFCGRAIRKKVKE